MSTTFFYSAKLTLVNVGSGEGSGFRAIATCIIDQQLAPNNQDHTLLNTLLETMYTYYPKEHILPRGNLSSEEQLNFYKRSLRLPVLIEQLAYTLKEMAYLEIRKNPTQYRDAYSNLRENSGEEATKNTEMHLNTSTIQALEKILDMQVVVFNVAQDKEMHAKVPSKSQGKHSISIQLDINTHQYMAKVHNPSWFRAIAHVPQRAPRPKLLENPIFPNKAFVLKQLNEEDGNQATKYLEAKNLLSHMSAKEILDLYIKKIPTSDYPSNRRNLGNISSAKNYDDHMTESLIHVLAHAESTGHISLDEFKNLNPVMNYKKP